MKTNYDICHEFAQGYKTNGRGSNIFYETETNGDRVLYSYGHHFAIARITPQGVCFFTTAYYSATTAKHVSNARGALCHYPLIFCPDPIRARECWKAWECEMREAEKALTFARKPEKYTAEIRHTLAQLRAYCEATGETAPEYAAEFEKIAETAQPRPEAREAAQREREAERQRAAQRAEWKREAEERREAQERARRLTQAERVQAWERGENVYLNWEDTAENVPLRIEARKGYKVVKTAKGVTVTIEAARRFYEALTRGEIQQGQKIDTGATTYTAGAIDSETVHVGCHTWKRAYLDNFAQILATI